MNPISGQVTKVAPMGATDAVDIKPVQSVSKGQGQASDNSQAASEISRASVERVVSQISQAVGDKLNVGLQVDSGSNRLVILVTDPDSGELIRQIPSEDALARADKIRDIQSLMFDQKV